MGIWTPDSVSASQLDNHSATWTDWLNMLLGLLPIQDDEINRKQCWWPGSAGVSCHIRKCYRGNSWDLRESPRGTSHRRKDKYSWKVWEYSSCVIQAINMLFLISGGCNLFWTFWRIYTLNSRLVSQVWHFIVNKIITVKILIYPWPIWIEKIYENKNKLSKIYDRINQTFLSQAYDAGV